MAKEKEMLEPKRMLRVGFDFALGMMRAAAQGTTTFVEARKTRKFPESASASVRTFFASASQSAQDTVAEVERERETQDAEDDEKKLIQELRKQLAAQHQQGRPDEVDEKAERTGEFTGARRSGGR
jgi:hypothetical protein